MKHRAAILLLACLLCSGCALSYYRGKDGSKLLRLTFGTDQQIGPFELRKDGSVALGGAQTKQSESAGEVAGAITEAMKPKLLP